MIAKADMIRHLRAEIAAAERLLAVPVLSGRPYVLGTEDGLLVLTDLGNGFFELRPATPDLPGALRLTRQAAAERVANWNAGAGLAGNRVRPMHHLDLLRAMVAEYRKMIARLEG